MRRVSIGVTIALLCFATVRGGIRQWKPNTNFDNPSNWNSQVRCSNDRLVMPADIQAVVFIQQNDSLQELRLPNNGVLVFEEGSSIIFSSEPDKRRGCSRQGNEVKFMASPTKSWFDPINWCIGQDCVEDTGEIAYVDAERVPCVSDDVIFPPKNSFRVDVHSNAPITVRSIQMKGMQYSSSQAFSAYTSSKIGSIEFFSSEKKALSRMSISSGGCREPGGCVCDNIHGYMEELVCPRNTQCPSQLTCSHPVKAIGNCCPLCGSLLNVTVSSAFNLSHFQTNLHLMITSSPSPAERRAVTKVSASELQILLLGQKDGNGKDDLAVVVGCFLQQSLMHSKTQQQLGITSVQVANSDGNSCHKHQGPDASTQLQSSSGTIVGAVAAVFIITAILVIGFIFRHIIYRRVRELTGKIPLPKVLYNGRKAEIQAFENPVFDGVPLPFTSPHTENSMTLVYNAECETVLGFDNPTYCEKFSNVSMPQPEVSALGIVSAPTHTTLTSNFAAAAASSPSSFSTATLGFDNPLSAAVSPLRLAGATRGFDNPLLTVVSPPRLSAATLGFENPLSAATSPPQLASASPIIETLNPTVLSPPRRDAASLGCDTSIGASSSPTHFDLGTIGFDNPLSGNQDGVASALAWHRGHSGAMPPAACHVKQQAPDDQASSHRRWGLPKRPKISLTTTGDTALLKSADDNGFTNPVYQSPTVETVPFGLYDGRPAFGVASTAQPRNGRFLDESIEDDFIDDNGAVPSDREDLIL